MTQKVMMALMMLVIGVVISGFDASVVRADEATEAILDVLHSRGDISDETYEELMEKEKKEDKGFDAYFDKRLHVDSKDGQFKLRVGGRLMMDMVAINADKGFEAAEDATGNTFEGTGVEFRQARLHMAGTLYNRYAFKNEFDFAAGKVNFKENWIEIRKLPYVGNMRLGHTKEPFSLERLNSRLYMPLMERALPNGIVPGRNTGLRFHNSLVAQRMSWSLGFFKETGGNGDDFTDHGDYNITGRLTYAPWYEDNGSRLLHLGMAYSHKFCNEEAEETWLRFKKLPEVHIPELVPVETGSLKADGADMFGPEVALVIGPFCIQGEYWQVNLDSQAHDDPSFNGYYVLCSYFLTGEHRNYKIAGNDGAEFGMVKIKNLFDPSNGKWGAWQIAARYADIDLNDNDVYGGKMDDITLGVNWYPNPNVRWSFNYVHINVEDSYAVADISDGDADIYQARFHIYF